ncbi:MAG: hypothetical protein LBT82_00675 [Oscillospiraceae bacterium]|jgi:hypothetical protein|nr:hypothetical protein [Oscillospiraceae bacterium]
MECKPKGYLYLKISSIIIIVLNFLGLGTIISQMINPSELTSNIEKSLSVKNINEESILITIFISLLTILWGLITGTLGILNSEKIEKAKDCVIFGIIYLVLFLTNGIIATLSLNYPLVILICLVGAVLPVLYLVGALKNKEYLE